MLFRFFGYLDVSTETASAEELARLRSENARCTTLKEWQLEHEILRGQPRISLRR